MRFRTRKLPLPIQYVLSMVSVLVVSLICFSTADLIGYRLVAMVLLMTTSIVAMLFEIIPVLLAAILSAVIWNFFFIPPLYTFHIEYAEDVVMFLLYFVVAIVNAVLTFKIRAAEKKARDQEEKEKTILLYNTLLNSLSHELRTPLATIIGAVDTLRDHPEKLTAASQAALMEEVDKAAARLNQQVENLLNMSRLESGNLKLRMDWCDVNELVHTVIRKNNLSNTHLIQFFPDEQLPLFKLDAGIMEHVLHNLIHNAILYTPEKSIVSIQVENAQNACVFHISDNGPGIPQEDKFQVFEKFFRLPGNRAGGSGLGLSIVKGFVEAHQGRIELQDAPQGGAYFKVYIPAEKSYITNLKNE